jgi:hypothetical protein
MAMAAAFGFDVAPDLLTPAAEPGDADTGAAPAKSSLSNVLAAAKALGVGAAPAPEIFVGPPAPVAAIETATPEPEAAPTTAVVPSLPAPEPEPVAALEATVRRGDARRRPCARRCPHWFPSPSPWYQPPADTTAAKPRRRLDQLRSLEDAPAGTCALPRIARSGRPACDASLLAEPQLPGTVAAAPDPVASALCRPARPNAPGGR